jgi:NAD(P)-dependent dehydrogenase (short-subunit alcohol dehydrogenase family)
MHGFDGRNAVITGAGSGLGREFARLGAGLGMSLMLADVQEDALEATRAELDAAGARVHAMRTDVSDAAAVNALADAAFSKLGAVHLLFNNAGVATSGLAWEHSIEDWRWTLGVNLWGVIHGIHAFVPRMLEAARADAGYRGHVVNTASMAGLLNAPNMAAYNASKHAVVALSETLQHDLGLVTAQIGASVLCPYFVPTAIHRSQRNRPDGLQAAGAQTVSQRVSQAMLDKAVASGRVSAQQVAHATFEAVAECRFYVFSHPEALAPVLQRAEHLVAGRNPPDPYAGKPALRAELEAALRQQQGVDA